VSLACLRECSIDPLWPKTKLGDVAEFKNGVNYSAKNKGEGMRVIGVGHFKNKLKSDGENLDQINPKDIVGHKDLLLDGDILFVRSNGNKVLVGRSLVVRTLGHKVTHSAFTIRLRFTSKEVEPLFFGYIFKSPECRAALTGRGANISNLTQEMLQAIEVPLPPRPIQGRIVETMEEEAAMIDANRKLVELYQKKIQHKLTEIWGKEAE